MTAHLSPPSVIPMPPRRRRTQLNPEIVLDFERREFEPRLAAVARLDDLDYERQREDVAEKLKVRITFLDEQRASRRASVTGEDIPDNHDHWRVEPWGDPIDTAVLLRAVTDRITQHVATLDSRAIAVGLWVMFTWVHENAVDSPLLLVTSPERESGKTTLLDVLQYLVRRPLKSVSISGPALFRSIKRWVPTFLIDEADATFRNNDDLREVINAGWTRGQGVWRCYPEPQHFSTFAPKAIAMKGRRLDDTTSSRSITIEMKRKTPGEVVQDFDRQDDGEFRILRRQLRRWASDNGSALGKADPQIIPGFHDRTRMNWKILLAIAELAGEEAKRKAWAAAQAIQQSKDAEDGSRTVELLADIRTLFDETGEQSMLSRDMVKKLAEDPARPWTEYDHAAKPITQRQLAALLREFRIFPVEVHVDQHTHGKGYKRQQFEDAFGRYLPPGLNAKPRNRANPTKSDTCSVEDPREPRRARG
jgi:putative DNA primase/helicase